MVLNVHRNDAMFNLQSLKDEDLITGALEGSHAHFNALVDRYASPLYRMAYGITRRHQDAEDIVQETFIRAFDHLNQYASERGSVKTWLFTIARNQSINVLGALKRSMARFFFDPRQDENSPDPLDLQPDLRQDDSEVKLAAKQEIARVQEALSKLPERQRTALTLKAQEDLSYEEIAAVMGTSVSSVESLIFRARKRLMETL